MNIICLGSFKGSHLIINQEKYDRLIATHPATDDGYIHIVGGIVKDPVGRIYLQQNAKLNEFYFPGGKVEQGETFEQTLMRELKEEIDIDVRESHYRGCFKVVASGVRRCLHFFDIVEYVGVPTNQEPHKCNNYWVEILNSDNELGFAVKVDGIITDDVQDILHSFFDINIIKNIFPMIDIAILQDAIMMPYDETLIDLSDHYYLYFDISQKNYFFDKLS